MQHVVMSAAVQDLLFHEAIDPWPRAASLCVEASPVASHYLEDLATLLPRKLENTEARLVSTALMSRFALFEVQDV